VADSQVQDTFRPGAVVVFRQDLHLEVLCIQVDSWQQTVELALAVVQAQHTAESYSQEVAAVAVQIVVASSLA